MKNIKLKFMAFAAALAVLMGGIAAPTLQAAAYDSAALVSAVNAEYTGAADGIDGVAILFLSLIAGATIIVLFAGWIKKGRTAK